MNTPARRSKPMQISGRPKIAYVATTGQREKEGGPCQAEAAVTEALTVEGPGEPGVRRGRVTCG